ncbi:MAG: DUF4388 domain-containing protein [bacterium]|nr:DUF4388 domain-containing protein [bacterium]
MSLVGNLEDLSLGDILQIISLSQKSGVLALSSDLGSGRIVFRNGMVQAACLKGHPNDLRALLVGEAVIDPAGYDAALARAQEQGIPVEDALSSEASITREEIDALITKAAENAILEMFSWPSGDFSFDVRNELDPEDPHLILPNGINAQYLAMEGLRIRDERARDGGGETGSDPEADTNPNIGADQDPLFGSDILEVDEGGGEDTLPVLEVEPLDPNAQTLGGATTPADVLVEGILARADETSELSIDEIAKAMPLDSDPVATAGAGAGGDESVPGATAGPVPDPEPRVPEDEVETPVEAHEDTAPASVPGEARESTPAAPAPGVPASAPAANARRMPVVLIDPDVTVLEWVKTAIEDDFARVHMFQKADQGLTRIRQYLIRGTTPLVLVSPETPIDPLSGIHGLADFVKRLKSQSPRIVVIGLREDDGVAPAAMPGVLNGVLSRPPRRLLADTLSPESTSASQGLSRALLEILAQQVEGNAKAPNSAESLRGLRDATAQLQEASSRGEILPVVLDFAAEIFARVAILVVRDDEVFAVAGRGFSSLEVDPLGSAEPVTMPTPDTGWLRRVLDGGKALVATPDEPSDHLLLEKLGGEVPQSAYVGPIESGDAVIAMLYADQSTSDAPMPDTHGLEVVLHHAGLALDRAALERALWEADAEAR